MPLAVPARNTTGQFADWPTSTLGATSVSVAVCNASNSASHTIKAVRLKLASFAAYTGQLNELDYCASTYTRPTGAALNNCDRGGPQIDEELRAASASDAQVGDVVDATQQSNPPADGLGPLPVILPPGSVMYLNTILSVSAAGTYSFSVSIGADGMQLPFTGAASLLLAPVAHLWNGAACSAPGMLAQIPPATTPPTDYICPIS